MTQRLRAAAAAALITLALAAQTLAAGKELTIRGRLRPTVEAGGWVIETGEQKYLLLNAARFRRQGWFREGAEVVAVGRTKTGVVSVFMEGTPFEARTLKPAPRAAVRRASFEYADQNATAAPVLTQQPAPTPQAASPGATRVTVSGEAVVQAQPDTAVLSVAVVTQNASASEAQAANAALAEAVVRAVRAAAGAGAEVKTGGYSLQPQYVYKENASPQITGYQARNSVTVTMPDLTKVGPVIDAAARAGANTVDFLNFTLRNDRQARASALAEATRDATARARAVAEALGGRVVRVVEVQEGPIYRPPVPVTVMRGKADMSMAEAVQTPVEPGALDIRGQVQLVVEVETRP